MSLFHCLGVPAHINKRITQNLTNSGRHSISAPSLFFAVLFYLMRNTHLLFQSNNRCFVSCKERDETCSETGTTKGNKHTSHFIWLNAGKNKSATRQEKKGHSVLVYCLPMCVWSAAPWLTVICPVHVHRPRVMRHTADSEADSFTRWLFSISDSPTVCK